MSGAEDVDAHLSRLPEPQRTTLIVLRERLRTALPTAEEMLKYGMPCFVVEGKGVAGYDGFKQHCSYFPMSGGVLDRVQGLPAGSVASKGTLQFPVDRPLSLAVVRKLVAARLDEIGEVDDGARIVFFPDGRVKAKGRMKDGRLHGKWSWYRADGSLMRTGQFHLGEKTGEWRTWPRP